jgi:hypothetical protein
MAKEAGHSPKKAAAKATKKIVDKSKKAAGVPVHADTTKPAAHAATASTA